MAEAVRILTELTGAAPLGWYTGRDSPQTRRLVVEHGGFLYDSDSYADDLPYWTRVADKDHLVVPYTLDTNDMKYVSPSGFPTGTDFFTYLRDAFDVLYAEGAAGAPKMLSIGLHCRLVGRPARIAALERFLDHVQQHDKVWIARRVDIARHWVENFPPGVPSVTLLAFRGACIGAGGDCAPGRRRAVAGPAPQASAADLAGKTVVIDAGHGASADGPLSRQVPNGRGGTKDCQTSGTSTERRVPRAHVHLGRGIPDPGPTDRPRRHHRDDPRTTTPGPRRASMQRAATANAAHPDAIVSIHGDGGPASGHGFHVNYSAPPLNDAQSGAAMRLAAVMRDQLVASGLAPSTYIGSDGLYGRADLAGLNLADYPAVLIELGNMRNADDAAAMTSSEGQAALCRRRGEGRRGLPRGLTTRAIRSASRSALDSPAAGDSRLAACSRSATSPA